MVSDTNLQKITLGGGCFWCLEAVFQALHGVTAVISGYTDGNNPNPSYEEVCTGTTGHVEVVQIEFDSKKISLHDILRIFWHIHDPTTLNRQGHDVGTQYRSAIFYHSSEQKKIIEEIKGEITQEKTWPNPIVTEIKSLEKFYPAEDYHQSYFVNHTYQPYCQSIILPKLQKLKSLFSKHL